MGDAEPLPDERVKALLGRVPSKADRERLAKVRDALGIRSTDAVWDIMIALDYRYRVGHLRSVSRTPPPTPAPIPTPRASHPWALVSVEAHASRATK